MTALLTTKTLLRDGRAVLLLWALMLVPAGVAALVRDWGQLKRRPQDSDALSTISTIEPTLFPKGQGP
jgi:hypothetical protein